jgi:nickel-type superoxide dismutase maturation protease
MSPLLQPGDEVFVKPCNQGNQRLTVGDIVTLWHPTQPGLKIVKRIAQSHHDSDITRDRYFVQGDNPAESTDSRHFGWIDADQIIGKVLCRFDYEPTSPKP